MFATVEVPGSPPITADFGDSVPSVGDVVRLPRGQARTRRYVVESVERTLARAAGGGPESHFVVAEAVVRLRPEP